MFQMDFKVTGCKHFSLCAGITESLWSSYEASKSELHKSRWSKLWCFYCQILYVCVPRRCFQDKLKWWEFSTNNSHDKDCGCHPSSLSFIVHSLSYNGKLKQQNLFQDIFIWAIYSWNHLHKHSLAVISFHFVCFAIYVFFKGGFIKTAHGWALVRY